jgi:hypothetical protein
MNTTHRFPEETPEEPKDAFALARDAVAYALHQICASPAKFYLMGNGTETYAQLTAAYAAFRGIPVEEVRTYFQPQKAEYERFLAERRADQESLELAATLHEMAGTADAEDLTRLVSLGRHVRESNKLSSVDGGAR